jgi:hypothetical protein
MAKSREKDNDGRVFPFRPLLALEEALRALLKGSPSANGRVDLGRRGTASHL